jgi:hypothetical protein
MLTQAPGDILGPIDFPTPVVTHSVARNCFLRRGRGVCGKPGMRTVPPRDLSQFHANADG